MANLSKDIQCAGSDTRSPMVDRTDFASWQERIRLYCQGKENEKDRYNPDIRATNILLQGLPKDIYTRINHYTNAKDIWDNVKMLLEGSELTKEEHYLQSSTTLPSTYVPPYLADYAHLDSGLSSMENLIENLTNTLSLLTQSYKTFLPQTNNQLRTSSNTRNQATVQDGRVVVQNVSSRLNRGQGTIHRVEVQLDKMLLMQAQENRVALDEEQLLFLTGGQDKDINEDVGEQPVQDLDLNVDNVFQADECDAFNSNVDEGLTTQTMFMANLSFPDPVYDEVSPSYDSNILSEVYDHDHYQDAVCEHHEEHKMHDNVQLNHVVDSHADYTIDSNMISYDQYVKDNAVPGVQSNVSSVPNDAYMMIYNDMYEPHAQSVSKTSRSTVVDNSLNTELATYKEQEMKDVFDELEDEVDQNVVDRKHDEIERKNLLIENDNLIVECMSKEVFYVATNSKLNVSRFTKMHFAHTIVEARCLELEGELSNLCDKIHNDNHNELINRFFDIETRGEADRTFDFRALDFQLTKLTEKVTVLQEQNNLFRAKNEKIKKHYKELYDSIKITRAKHIEQTTALTTENVNMKAQILNNVNSVIKDHVKPTVLAPAQILNNVNSVSKDHVKPIVLAPGKYVIDVKPIPSRLMNNREAHLDYLRHFKESVETIYEIVEEAKVVIQIVLWYLDSGYSKHMTGDRSRLMSFVKKFIGTVRFENDHFGAIMGYEDYVIGDIVISKHSCYVRDTDGVELIKGSHVSNLYTISVEDMMKSFPIYLLSKASKNKSWLWHWRLNHLNFDTINDLARKDLVRGLRRLKFEKDHLCSACQLGKSKNHTHKLKTKNTNLEVLDTLHMDLCGPMQVQTINGKKYILVIVDDYSLFTWVKFLRSKDETPEVVIKFLQQIQTIPRTPQQNNVVERRNRTLVEAAWIMLIFFKAPMFLWAEVVATTCYTQNRSLIHTRHNKIPCELVHNKKLDLTFFRGFGALCYPTNNSEDLGKLQPIADIRIFVGYAPSRKSYRIYNKRTR
nr:hypothetical protein [Tanacetum cinerariifolium]